MRICFESGGDDESYGEDLLLHLKMRKVGVVPFDPEADMSGMIAEISEPTSVVRDHALMTADQFGLPVLALSRRHDGRPIPDAIADNADIRVVRYGSLSVARVAIDMFLEAHCGYRVPLGAEDQENYSEGSSKRL